MTLPSWYDNSTVHALESLLRRERDRLAEAVYENYEYREPAYERHTTKAGSAIDVADGVYWPLAKQDAFDADLYFIDPPFNIGQKYTGHNDKLPAEVHWSMWRLMISGVAAAGNDDSAFAFHVPAELLQQTLQHAEDAGLELWQQVIRTYNFGQYGETKFIGGHENLLIFHKAGGQCPFDARAVLVEGHRRLMKTPDKRIKKAKWKGYVPPPTHWHFSRPQGNNHERWKNMPNQLPFAYLARLVLSKSQTKVVELCAGSGSMLMVCEAAGRKYVGCEISGPAVSKIVDRSNDARQHELAAAAMASVRGPETIELPPGRDWSEV